MNNTIKFSVDVKNNGKRLDIFLREKLKDFTRSYLKKIIENKQVKLNSSVLTVPSTKIRIKDEIVINCISFCGVCDPPPKRPRIELEAEPIL